MKKKKLKQTKLVSGKILRSDTDDGKAESPCLLRLCQSWVLKSLQPSLWRQGGEQSLWLCGMRGATAGGGAAGRQAGFRLLAGLRTSASKGHASWVLSTWWWSGRDVWTSHLKHTIWNQAFMCLNPVYNKISTLWTSASLTIKRGK